MLVPFHEMPGDARLWIYQSNRSLSPHEVAFVKQCTEEFIQRWQAHGQDLKASYKIEYDQFLIISVDESFSQASGCSIDSSVHLIKALEHELQVSFMTSGQVAFLIDDQIRLFPFAELKDQVKKSILKAETKIFDNTVKNVAELSEKWLVSSEKTWFNRYL
ncbi:MAG: hypothetical protein AAF616_05045 [Bacteroidota bacterium]